MKTETFLRILAGLLCAGNTGAENPLEFREYTQTVRLEFLSPREAQQAQLLANPLPKNYKLAVSARWDDSAWEHLRTLEHMKKYGLKGTFYQNNPVWCLRRDPDYLKTLQTGGCSIGLHTVTHPHLPCVDSVSHFREYMRNRIMLEVSGQACINSQVLPFCDWWEPVAHVTGSIGHGMRAAGIISSPDVMMKSEHRPALGHPPRSHAYSRILTPGDREPKLAVFEKQLKSCLADAETLRENPSISMAMHSWHSEEGLKTLDLIFERLARRPDWWYCNQTEYGADRYEALNCSVRKETQDCAAICSITRMTPAELGADVPLWFTVSAATPLKAAGGRLHGTLLEVPHDSQREVPRKIGRMMKNGTSSEFPELSLTLASLGAGKWRAVIKNQGRSDLRECEFTFRFPAVWEKAAMRADLPAVKAGSSASVTVVQPSRRPELYFQYGAPYAALQLDFRRNGKQNRLYAEWEEPAPEKLPLPPDDAALICEMPPNADPAGISRPDTVLAKSGLTASRHIRKRKNAGPYSIHPVIDNRKWPRDTAVLAILDFETDSASPLQFRSRSLEAWLKCEIWFNGKKIGPAHSGTVDLQPLSGRNRLVFRTPPNHGIVFTLTGREDSQIKFLKTE